MRCRSGGLCTSSVPAKRKGDGKGKGAESRCDKLQEAASARCSNKSKWLLADLQVVSWHSHICYNLTPAISASTAEWGLQTTTQAKQKTPCPVPPPLKTQTLCLDCKPTVKGHIVAGQFGPLILLQGLMFPVFQRKDRGVLTAGHHLVAAQKWKCIARCSTSRPQICCMTVWHTGWDPQLGVSAPQRAG